MGISGSRETIRFVSPLTDEQHAQLGRVVVLWGQIDYMLDHLLSAASKLSASQLRALSLMEKPLGAKIDFLKASLHQVADTAIKADLENYCDNLHGVKERRNFALHGVWGLRAEAKSETVAPAARLHANVTKPFKLAQLEKLEADLCKVSAQGIKIHYAFQRIIKTGLERLVFHVESETPRWLEQWLKRNPMDHETPDYIGTAGQLPYRSSPYQP